MRRSFNTSWRNMVHMEWQFQRTSRRMLKSTASTQHTRCSPHSRRSWPCLSLGSRRTSSATMRHATASRRLLARAQKAAASWPAHSKSQPHGSRTASRNHTASAQQVAATRLAHSKLQPHCPRTASRSNTARAQQVAATRLAHSKSQPHGVRTANA
jgi:hypothetical protein